MTRTTRGRPWAFALVALAAGVFLAPTAAQTAPPTPLPTFEVASIKQNKSGDGFIRFGLQPGGRFSALNAPVIELVRVAFAVQPFQIEGAPGWMRSDRYDITAKTDIDTPPMTPSQLGPVQLMMQSLLAERFKLKARRETKEMPIYALTLARSDGRLGRQMEASKADCAALAAARGRGGPGAAGRGGPPAPPAPGERVPCGMFMGPASLAAGGVTMAQLAQALSQRVGRVVLDKTGLQGLYEFNLEFTPEQLPPPGAFANGQAPQIDPNGPSIYTALQEQLGLKLDAQRGPVEMLVIDSVEPPTPD
jgi:uncharacterized protein (TIGR03435 family)